MYRSLQMLCLFGFFILFTCTAELTAQDQVRLRPVQDNTLYEDPSGLISNGAGSHFFTGENAGGLIRRGLLAFDIAGNIPPGATITSVSLTLNMSRTSSGPQSVALHSVFAAWGEGTSDASGNEGMGAAATTDDATWIHTFFNTGFWQAPGGDFNGQGATATLTVDQEGLYTWPSTPQMIGEVQFWLDNPSANNGWLVKGNETGAGTSKRFDSRDHPDPSVHPVLTVEFLVPPSYNANLYSVSPFDDQVFLINPADGSTINSVPVTVNGNFIQGCNGLAADPFTNELYIVIGGGGKSPEGIQPPGGRILARVDPETGIADSIAEMGDFFAGLAFDDNGTLYGVTGDGGIISEALFIIETDSADTTLFMLLGNGSDGESIAYNPTDGLMYHGSGLSTKVFETIDLASKMITNIPITGDPFGEFRAIVYRDSDTLLLADGDLNSISTDGVVTFLGNMDHTSKGMAFVPIAPRQPKNVMGSETGGDITLTWDPNLEIDLLGYTVYRNTLNDLSTADSVGNTSNISFTDVSASSGAWYYYWVTANDSDGNGGLASASAAVRFNGPPVWSLPASFSFDEDSQLMVDLDDFVSDDFDDNADLVITGFSGNDIAVSVDPGTHVATFTAPSDFNGSEDLNLRATDLDGALADASVTVIVNAVNDVPVISAAIPDLARAEDFAKTFVADLNTVFSDVDGDALNYTATPLSAGVTTQISNDSLYLRSEANFNGSVNIDVTASDPSAAAVTDQFSVNVASVNDLPTAFGLISLTNGALTGDPTPDFLWESSSDADGDDLIYTLEISASTDFSTPDGSESGADTAVTLSQALASGTWFWRVVADDGNDGSVASTDTNSFLLDATPPDLVAGVLLSTVIPSALSVYVASDEPISEDGISATMTLKDDGGNVVDTATELFVQLSNHDEVYNATYRIPATAPIGSGTLEIDVTGSDVLGNTTILSRVFVIGSVAKQSAFVLKGFDGQVELSGTRGAVEETGYVLVGRNETAQLPDNLRAAIDEDREMTPVKWTAVGSTLEVIGTVPLAKPLNLTVEYTAGDIAELSSVSEFDERKIGLYEQEGTAWVYAGGEGASYRLTGKIHQFGKSSLYYNPDHEFLPQKISLDQNYPNPFNPVTTIRYGVPEESKVKLVIYNILGQQVKVLVRDNRRAGYHQVIWDGRNELGVQVSSGVYIYRIQHASGVVARKMLFVK